MKTIKRAAALALGLAIAGFAVQAEQITLNSVDGSAFVTGELVAFKDGFYIVDTVFGELMLSADAVTCASGPCTATPDAQMAMND